MHPATPNPSPPRVALLIESSRAYGRDLLLGVAHYLRVHGPWAVEFQESALDGELPAWFQRWRGDGILARVKTPAMAAAIACLQVPVVDLFCGLPQLHLPAIRSDEMAVGRLAAQHLLERGLRQFAFCGYNGADWSDLRQAGFKQKLSVAGRDCQVFVNLGPGGEGSHADYEEHGEQNEERLARWLLSLPRPIGLMACNDVRGRQVLNACDRLKLAVPDEVAVIGVDKDEVMCELSVLPLSSVILNTQRIGFEAAALLDRLMAGKPAPKEMILIEPLGVATRRSTEVLAIEDPHIATALRFIREQACHGVTVADVLKTVPMSRRSFERRFAQVMGHPPKVEILRAQMDRARQLLSESDLPCAQVAEKSGFCNAEYLSRIFKRKTGVTPGDFRLQSRLTRPVVRA
jgi:LacI family transcriptional regulator